MLLAYDRRVAVIFVGTAAAVFVLLRVVAALLMMVARRLPRPHSAGLRMAIANIHRPGALTPTIVLSLGLGITLLVTVIEIDGNLRRQFSNELPAKAPSFYFLDIPADQTERFDTFIRAHAPSAKLDDVPMLRGRIISAGGMPAENIKPREDAAWVLQSDRGITYASEIPTGSRLVEGQWWGTDYNGPPLVSFEKRIADGLGLKLGDPVTVNVLGRNITATIANMRTVDWESLGINFVMVFSPNAFAGAPHTHLATLTYPGGGTPAQEAAIDPGGGRSLSRWSPPCASRRRWKQSAALSPTWCWRSAAPAPSRLIAAALVLGGALAAGHRHRVYDAVILKTLGATRRRLLSAYAIEYLLIGVGHGALRGDRRLARGLADRRRSSCTCRLPGCPGRRLAAAGVAVMVTVTLGLAGTYVALGQKPAPVLRNL